MPTPDALAVNRKALCDYAARADGGGYDSQLSALCNTFAALVRAPPHAVSGAGAPQLDHDPMLVQKMSEAKEVFTLHQYTTGTVPGVKNCARAIAFNDMQVADLKRRGVLPAACVVRSLFGQRAPVGCLQGTKAKAVMKELADEGIPVTAHGIRAGCVQADVLVEGWHPDVELGTVLPTTTYSEVMEAAIAIGTCVSARDQPPRMPPGGSG